MSGHRFYRYGLKQVKEDAGVYEVSNQIKKPADVDAVLRIVLDLHNESVEKFGILTLSTKHKITGIHICSVGLLDTTLIHPREIFKFAILSNCSGIICFHNHPSGDPTPSPEDIGITKRLVEAGQIIGIEVLDHIIVGDEGRYVSLQSQGNM